MRSFHEYRNLINEQIERQELLREDIGEHPMAGRVSGRAPVAAAPDEPRRDPSVLSRIMSKIRGQRRQEPEQTGQSHFRFRDRDTKGGGMDLRLPGNNPYDALASVAHVEPIGQVFDIRLPKRLGAGRERTMMWQDDDAVFRVAGYNKEDALARFLRTNADRIRVDEVEPTFDTKKSGGLRADKPIRSDLFPSSAAAKISRKDRGGSKKSDPHQGYFGFGNNFGLGT